MSAHPDEQAAYLKSVDPDFAQAPPTEQRMYLSHVNRVAPDVSAPNLGGMIQEDETTARTAGLPGGSSIPHQPSDTELNLRAVPAGLAALWAAPAVVSSAVIPAARYAERVMGDHPIKSMAAIEAAKHLPGVLGQVAGKIPSWAPMLARGGGPVAEAEGAGLSRTRLGPDAPPPEIRQSRGLGGYEPAGGAEALADVPTPAMKSPPPVFSKTRLGPDAPPPEVGMARGLGGYAPAEGPDALGKIPVQPQPATPYQPSLRAGQYEAPASPLPPQGQLGEGVIEGEYMDEPSPPPPTIRGALPRGQYEAPASTLPPPKLLGPARTRPPGPPPTNGRRAASFIDNSTPAVQAGPPKFGDLDTTVPQEDMTPILQKMLKGTKKPKQNKASR